MEKLKAKQTVSDLTEAEAIKHAKEGDAAAFEFLYKAHCRRVYSLCLRMIKNPAEAEDLTQQAFLSEYPTIRPGDHRKIGSKDNFRVADHPRSDLIHRRFDYT